jgi:hypothetical protein
VDRPFTVAVQYQELPVVGFAGVRLYRDFAGARWSFAFFGFFASRLRLSRVPVTHSFFALD